VKHHCCPDFGRLEWVRSDLTCPCCVSRGWLSACIPPSQDAGTFKFGEYVSFDRLAPNPPPPRARHRFGPDIGDPYPAAFGFGPCGAIESRTK